ncbi:tRNA1(Val) (adenine(37)-N6)-methyltransferase [Gudongella sp. DL1XJH-153]|uniref:tRNA1(Val) (adenine(37)-N6)-methyltransferase n=1 Tax=Gudongella sp. DL1XJH-153 TaxID=3409804 RepID=UPI003BB6205A
MRRIDDVPGTEYKIIQDKGLFSYGVDAILLSYFSRPKGVVVDLGTGTGVIPLRVADKKGVSIVYGVEIQEEVARMAQETVAMNSLQDKVKILHIDMKKLPEIFGKASVDTVITNPPYMKPGGAIVNKHDNFAISRHEIAATLEDIAVVCEHILKPLGKLYMVHRPNRLVDVLYTLRSHGLEPKYIQWVYPKPGKQPNLFLLEAVKGGKSDFKYREPILVYDENGEYTEDIYEIYGMSR